MMGLAQKIFREKLGKDLLESKKAECVNEENFSYIDLALADFLLKEIEFPDEAFKLQAHQLICRLSSAAREGHLCVEITEEINFPSTLVTQMDVDHLTALPKTPLCKIKNLYYFHRYWIQETFFLQNFLKMSGQKPLLTFNQEKACGIIDDLKSKNKLLNEQAQAIHAVLNNSLTVICGGPGTGKTYTAGLLFKILKESKDPQEHCEIALAAPTGKAAMNLQKSLASVFEEVPQVNTLHRLLGIGRKQKESVKLSADVILIDECSMIDANVMGKLMAAVKPGARLILLGDKYQLPPIEAGSFFADIMTYFESSQKTVIELKTCLRAELKEIVDFAENINQGNTEIFFQMLRQGIVAYQNLDEVRVSEILSKLLKRVKSLFSIQQVCKEDPLQMLHQFDHFRLLSPLRKGPFGVDQLNQMILNGLMQQCQTDIVILPIMITQNHPRLNLSNGEVGVLIRHLKGDKKEDYAIFSTQNENKETFRSLPLLLLPQYEYAFCMSVHKSQGSEFKEVLLLVPSGSEKFGREMLYTAATRAKRKLELWANEKILHETIHHQRSRLSGIHERLHFF